MGRLTPQAPRRKPDPFLAYKQERITGMTVKPHTDTLFSAVVIVLIMCALAAWMGAF